ncbi:MAG TPA: beta-glucosidase BglX [Herpetosiphonaceae bacterium]
MHEMAVLNFGQIDPAIESRVDELLARMTLAEKIGQMNQGDVALMDDPDATIREGCVGSLLSIADPSAINHYQRIAAAETRLGIPLLIGNDVIHGYRTIFPIPLAEACTWDPALLERAARIAAEEASACGTNWIFAPMVDISRDPRWGRIAESAGEDVFLGMTLAAARVRGFQAADLASGKRVVACPKHYVAYGAAEAGRDYNTVDISERTLREVHLPPFKAAFDAGAGSVMSAFNDVNGLPATANPLTLRTILRDEWQWHGVVLTDYNAIGELVEHGIAEDLRAAARLSVLAGVDMDMITNALGAHLADLAARGEVPEALIDAAVRRILRLKFKLGLFDRPYVDESLAERIILRPDFRVAALDVARKSMVLLKNDGQLLPLSDTTRRVAVIGPLADDRHAPLGCWAGQGRADDVQTVLDGLRAVALQGVAISFARGCDVTGDRSDEIDAAVAAARAADVAVLVIGEDAKMSGEAHSRVHLGLPGKQQALLEAVHTTGTPVVVVLMTGRPLVIPWLAEHVPAILLAWHGGMTTGRAVADLLWGHANPSGKLTASLPRAEGQIPIYYAHKNTGRPAQGAGTRQFDEAFRSTYLDEPNTPLFPFGFGLSYTTFAYDDLVIETPRISRDGMLIARAVVRNTGRQAGDEIVQLYIRDDVASVTRPVKQLQGFQRIALQPGEQQSVRFVIPVQQLGFYGSDMQYGVEPGSFTIWIGPDSARGLTGRFEVLAERAAT